ncbi:rim15, signal transduction response regulator, partial [Coemansia sp. RSA 2607]
MSEGTPLSEGEALGRLAEKPEDYWDAALKQAGRSVQTPALAIANAQASKALPVSKRAHARKSTRSFLGTPDYLAPELLLGAGNGLAVDWWALGVCLFEFVCGYPPFTDQSPEAIFRNILNHAIDWPDEDGYVSEEAVELINALLHPDPTTRAHWKDIKAAKLFEGWDMSVIRQMEPPFVPQPDDDADTSYFEPCQRSEIQRLSNATFLQMDTPKKPSSTTSRQQSARATEVLPASDLPKESQQGSQRGSQRGRSTSGSTSVRNTHGTTSNVGQLKKLFSETTASEDNKDDNSQQQTVSETAENQEPSTARSIISSSSSDSYSFTNVDSKPVNVGAQSSSKTVIPFAVLPAAAAGEESDAELVLTPLRRRSSSSSINSLSEPEIEPIPTRRISSVAVSAAQLMENSGPLSPA